MSNGRSLAFHCVGIAAGLLLGGCSANDAPAPRADLAKPQPALMAFLNSIARCDVAAAKAESLGTEQDKHWIDAMAALVGGLRDYDQALLSRFGRQAIPIDVDLKQAVTELVNEPMVRFQDGLVKESGDRAEVDAALGHIRLAAQPPMYLRRDKVGWKVDLTLMRRDTLHTPESIEQYLMAGIALKIAARDVRAGHYKTLDEAQQAMADQPTHG
jgi:hypothetical protein